MPTNINLRVLLFQEGTSWVAQGIEYDIAAQGDSIREAKEAFIHTIAGQIVIDLQHNLEPLEGISPAPSQYLSVFDKGERLPDPVSLPAEVTPGYMIPFINQDFRVYA